MRFRRLVERRIGADASVDEQHIDTTKRLLELLHHAVELRMLRHVRALDQDVGRCITAPCRCSRAQTLRRRGQRRCVAPPLLWRVQCYIPGTIACPAAFRLALSVASPLVRAAFHRATVRE